MTNFKHWSCIVIQGTGNSEKEIPLLNRTWNHIFNLIADLLGHILQYILKTCDDCELSCLYRSVFIIVLTSVKIYKIYNLIYFILVRHTNNIKEITQLRPVWLLKLLHFHILVPWHVSVTTLKYWCSLRRWSVVTEICQGTKMWKCKTFNSHTGRSCVISLKYIMFK
jgi:hypothetical protein